MAFTVTQTLFTLLLLLPISAVAQTNGHIAVGNSLPAAENSSWLSPSGDFALGFRQHNNSDFFLLSIWYDKIPDRTIVWHAKGAPLAPRRSKVEITDGGLVLTSPHGEDLWTSQALTGVVAYAVMNDTGNFVLEDSNFDNLWESFKDPTDTMLPTKIMQRGGVLSLRQSETNFSEGRFQLRVNGDSNVVLNTINLPTTLPPKPYFKKDSIAGDHSNASSPGRQLVFNKSGYIEILKQYNEHINLKDNDEIVRTGNSYFRATLEFDGVFTLVCNLKPDKRPRCECPKGYSLLDPNDPYGSCKPDFIQGCEEDEHSTKKDLYYLEVLNNTDFPESDYGKLKPFTEENCINSCLQDCMCAVAIFSNGVTCCKKKLPVSNGRFTTSFPGKALMKVRKDNSRLPGPSFPNPGNEPVRKKKDQGGLILAGSVLLGCSIFITGTICLGFFFIYQKKIKKKNSTHNGSVREMNLRSFTYKELQEATDGFKEELGRGAFSIVYKGAIKMGSNVLPVAVKKLLGFCEEGVQRLLVYEFLSHGTLAAIEFAEEYKAILTDWAYDCFQEGAFDVLVEFDMEALDDMEKLERFVKVAIWCIQEDPSLRPNMRKVMHMLEGVVNVPVPPFPSPFTTMIPNQHSSKQA
ncbi:hypothetical protein FH972_009663 [Carpinus fangiana]|uniref:Bulb-type lectin domain-containing protein n=1 Tax=Carpinus fangiana TaxID=176857 RepID=A0A660KKY7_9ROSI|nr:hypothetical protein FH972_009663 [Carpinus fangiana]